MRNIVVKKSTFTISSPDEFLYCNVFDDLDMEIESSKFHSKYNMHKFYFNNRVVDYLNSLPNWVVSVDDINAFKKDLVTNGNRKNII